MMGFIRGGFWRMISSLFMKYEVFFLSHISPGKKKQLL